MPLEDLRLLAIFLAVLGAVFLSVGAQFQNDAVTDQSPESAKRGGLNLGQLLSLLRRPRWLIGTVFLGLAIVSQLSALALAPLIVVQPVGAIALVITSFLNARIYKLRLDRRTLLSIAVTMVGVGSFVSFAAQGAKDQVLTDQQLLLIVAALVSLIAGFALLFFFTRKSAGPLHYIFGAGVLYGFVASLAKVVLLRIRQGDFEWLTLLALLALIGATVLGGWFVQNAYASGPPDLVIAGLTVVDPAVAIGIAIVFLGEAQQAAPIQILGFAVSGMVAIAGVLMLSKFHPQLDQQKS
jgi:drug/metabolite transporter (DMT)-like permease